MSEQLHIASVVLNFNSAADVEVLLPQLLVQDGVQHTVIVVDNASVASDVKRLRIIFEEHCPLGTVCSTYELDSTIDSQGNEASAYLLLNHENGGYSAGNNVGLRLAEKLSADAVLVANPDMRITDSGYLAGLSRELFSNEKNCISASRIVGLNGKDQSPLREPGFWEEFFWFRFALGRRLSRLGPYVIPVTEEAPVSVPKVSGCCMMLRLRFLQAYDWLDENVFLYCEEPILSAKVARAQGRIVFVPTLSAVHGHKKSEKGSAGHNMLLFIESRKYYLKNYSNYGLVQRYFLFISYAALKIVHRIKLLA